MSGFLSIFKKLKEKGDSSIHDPCIDYLEKTIINKLMKVGARWINWMKEWKCLTEN